MNASVDSRQKRPIVYKVAVPTLDDVTSELNDMREMVRALVA